MGIPSTPTALRAWRKNSRDVGLDWTNVADATSYTIEFSTDGKTWAKVATLVGVGRYIRHNPSPTGSIQYRIFATNAEGNSPASTPITFVMDGPVVVPPVTPKPVEPMTPAKPVRMNGAISDASTAAVIGPFFRDVGWNSIRIWLSFDANGDVSEAKLKEINGFFAVGLTPRVCLTPAERRTGPISIPLKAIEKIKRLLDRRVQINLINECNHGGYWPNNDRLAAFKWAHEVAGLLKAAGFVCGSPSFTGWVSNWEGWWAEVEKNGWHQNFAVLVTHAYPNKKAATDPAGWLKDFVSMLQTARKIADRLKLRVDIDEWGFGLNVPDDTVAKLLPDVQKSLNEYTDASAYFIASRTGTAAKPREPHDSFSWLVDFKTGERREKVIAAFKAVKA